MQCFLKRNRIYLRKIRQQFYVENNNINSKINFINKDSEFRKLEILFEQKAFSQEDIKLINSSISQKHYDKISFIKNLQIDEENIQKQTKSTSLIRYIFITPYRFLFVDKDIKGDLDEVVIDIEKFNMKEFIKECIFGNEITKENQFFKILYHIITFTIMIKIFSWGYFWWLDEMDPVKTNTIVEKWKSIAEQFYRVEWDLKNNYIDIIEDIKNIK